MTTKIMKTCRILTLWIFIAIRVNAENCDNLGVLVYEDMACKPVHENDNKCPTHFECDTSEKSIDFCRLRGKTIPVGEQIDSNLTYASCNVGCLCVKHNDEAKINCAILDCPEWLGVPVKLGCYRKYNIGECCSAGEICPPFDDSVVCEVNGKTYKEGERFNPANSCYECVCKKGFKGVFEEPYCARSSCGAEIKHSSEIRKNCAPVYYNSEGDADIHCCPSSWFCPSGDLKTEPNESGKSDISCKFGETTLKGNEKFVTSIDEYSKKRTVTCTCVMPPLAICTGHW